MAAGRHGVYRDNDFKDHNSEINVSRRNFSYSKEEYDKLRQGSHNHDWDRNREREARERVRVRQKDIKEREAINGGYRSSSTSYSGSSGGGSGDGGPRRRGFSIKDADREPGELSSESGSDDAINSELQDKDNEVSQLGNGAHSPLDREKSPLNRKRKFSPIVWDREERETSNSYKIKTASTSTPLPPPPPLPKSSRQSPTLVKDAGGQISPSKDEKPSNPQIVPIKPPSEPELTGSIASDSLEKLSMSGWSNHELSEQVEDEDFVPTRNISSSRWADEASSPADEGEILDDEQVPKRRKKMLYSEMLEVRGNRNSSTPEVGELKRESSDRAKAKLSDSDDIRLKSSGDEYADDDLERTDYMEIDDDHDNNNKGSSGSRSDTDSEDGMDSRNTPEPAGPPQRSVNMLQGCRSVDEFERLNKIDEGTYGVVYRAKDKKTGEIVALKKVKMEKEREGFPLTSLREINILLSFHHPSIVDVKEVVVGSNLDSIFMVMEYMEHDLKGLMETMKQPFSQSEVKCLMLQLLEGVKYLHDNWVLHRDLKTSNLLLNNRGELKICDFGLSRQYGSPLKPYTHLVVTLWYRAPELLLGAKQYSTAIDLWSLGCIMAELLSKEPLFNGKTEFDQLDKIFRTLGTPNETIWAGFSKLPGVKVNFVKHQYNMLRKKFPATSFTGSPVLSDSGFDLLNKLLTYDPEKRITAEAALNHEWFREVPLPKSKDFMPTFPAQHAQDRRTRRIMRSPDPLEEQRRKELQQAELGTGGLFG